MFRPLVRGNVGLWYVTIAHPQEIREVEQGDENVEDATARGRP